MRQNNRKQNIKKERIIMIASSAFVMAALTMTGVYMKENSAQNQDDGYSIDFTGIESQAEDGIQEAGDAQKPHNAVTYPQGDDAMQEVPEDDLDYLPMEEAGSSLIQIPGLTDGVRSEADVASDEQLAMLEEQKATEKQPEEKDDKPQESGAAATEPIREQTPPGSGTARFGADCSRAACFGTAGVRAVCSGGGTTGMGCPGCEDIGVFF